MILRRLQLLAAFAGLGTISLLSSCEKSETYGSPTSVVPGEYNAVSTVFNRIRPETQNFTVDPSQAINIKGAAGTVISIPAGSFVTASGSFKPKTVTIHLIEVYDKREVALFHMGTTHGSNILEAAGLVYIMADEKGEELRLSAGNVINVTLAGTAYMPDTKLFVGDIDDNTGNFDWKPYPIDTNKTNVTIDGNNKYTMPCHKLGWFGCQRYKNLGTGKVKLKVNITSTKTGIKSKEVYMFCKGANSVVRMYVDPNDSSYTFGSAPAGQDVSIMAAGEYIDRFFAGFTSEKVTADVPILVPLEESTEEGFQNRLGSIK